jgi:unsaturated rhamnogalacturonyl hydrolase
MRKLFLIILFSFSINFVKAQTTWGVQFSDAIISRYSTTINSMTGKGWEYSNGIILHGMEDIYNQTSDADYLSYIKTFVDTYIGSTGTGISTYLSTSLDKIQPGILCLYLYKVTGLTKYKTAATLIRNYLNTYPRNSAGGFYHKSSYKNQMWLDGIYMAEPFLAKYGYRIGDKDSCLDEAAFQTLLIYRHTFDSNLNLLYHGWDETKSASWANKTTGVSPAVWSRAMGWYAMALVDILKYIPDDHAKYDSLRLVLNQVVTGLKTYQDATTGLWYQVVDKASTSGNWLETSGSGIFVYAIKTAVNYGWIDTSYLSVARKGWAGLKNKIDTYTDNLPRINDFAPAMGILDTYSAYISKSSVDCPVSSGTQHPHGYCAILKAAGVMEYTLPTQYRLQVYTDGNGTVVGDTVELYHNSGSVVTVNATPKTGYSFSHWSGDTTAYSSSIAVKMNGHKHITANFVATSTSVKENSTENTFKVECFPTITKGEFKVVIESPVTTNAEISITDLQGRCIRKTENILITSGKYEYSQEISSLENGVYLCTVRINNTQITKRIIKN